MCAACVPVIPANDASRSQRHDHFKMPREQQLSSMSNGASGATRAPLPVTTRTSCAGAPARCVKTSNA
jgi:hypothetical protein